MTNSNPLFNTSPTVTDPTPVTNFNPLFNTPAIAEVLIKSGFILSSGEGRRPIHDEPNRPTFNSLRQVAASPVIKNQGI